MEFHQEFSDFEFIWMLESGQLGREDFTHEAHVRLAYILIKKFGVDQAVKAIDRQIRLFTDREDLGEKYHQTITYAGARMVNFFMKQKPSIDFQQFIDENPGLLTHFKELMARHYSFDVFNSSRAKRQIIEPDLIAF